MRTCLYCLLMVLAFSACHDIKVGYLETENAIYVPDSLIIRLEPDVNLDYPRYIYESDWISTGIQGVLGTAPINYRITNVRAEGGGDAEAMKESCTINGAGIFSVPYHHELPIGTYYMSIEISNGDHSYQFDDIFRIIIVEK